MAGPATPVFDASQLNRQTMGNPRLQVEVLSLFVAEAERLMRQVEDAPDPQVRGDRLRALIALARNIGAMRLAEEARGVETQIGGEAPNLEGLRAAIGETLTFVQRAGI